MRMHGFMNHQTELKLAPAAAAGLQDRGARARLPLEAPEAAARPQDF